MLEIVTLLPAGFNRPSGRSFERDLIPILLVNRVSLDCFALPHEKTRQRSGRRSDGGVDEGTKDLLGELPILGQMTAASTNSDAYLPVHPGAAATMAPSRVSSTNWGNAIFLAPMIFGGLVWYWLQPGNSCGRVKPATAGRRWTCSIHSEIAHGTRRKRRSWSISSERSTKCFRPSGPGARQERENALDVTTLNVAAHRLQSLIHDRRILLTEQLPEKTRA